MKKSLFFFAAAALALTACTSEDDLVQTGPQKTVENQAVGFDIYTPAATNVTRAGLEGTMTTSRLQRPEAYGGGFGVYAFLVEDVDNSSGDDHATTYVDKGYRSTPTAPNFMVNEKILWNSVNQGWYYSPLKYWPNETDKDSQSKNAEMEGPTTISTGHSHLDRLTFFAYAPYVASTDPGVPGITRVTNSDGQIANSATGPAVLPKRYEPTVGYRASLDDANKAVDLLWGVAPSGGMNYTAVNGRTVTVKEGEPLMDMTKPDVNTNMKFLFQHALARINVKAVAAIDQVSPGGKLDPNTRITIKTIKLKGLFGKYGYLNLDNTFANVANWWSINGVNIESSTLLSTLEGVSDDDRTIIIDGDKIAEHLRYIAPTAPSTDPVSQQDIIGVTTVRQNVIEPALGTGGTKHCVSSLTSSSTNRLAYSETTPYYTSWDKDAGVSGLATANLERASKTFYFYNNDGSITREWFGSSTAAATFTYPQSILYYVESSGAEAFTKITDENKATYANYTAYTLAGKVYTPVSEAVGEGVTGTTYYVLTGNLEKAVPYYADDVTYYKRDANYYMVVPTNNIPNLSSTIAGNTADVEALRTVQVEIEYYITTEDTKLAKDRVQTKNVVVKDVVFPSLANGKSYNLNLILGLTSVKMEAEVDDWKVINVQGDLPQNTAD